MKHSTFTMFSEPTAQLAARRRGGVLRGSLAIAVAASLGLAAPLTAAAAGVGVPVANEDS